MQQIKVCYEYNIPKLALDHGLLFKKVHRLIQFKQNVGLKPYTGKNTELRKHSKNEFGKDFFKLMNEPVLGIMGNVTNQKDVRLVTNNYRRSYLTTKLSQNKMVFRRSFSDRNE